MKILHTADWHIGKFKGPTEDGINLRSLDTINCLKYMVSIAKDERRKDIQMKCLRQLILSKDFQNVVNS